MQRMYEAGSDNTLRRLGRARRCFPNSIVAYSLLVILALPLAGCSRKGTRQVEAAIPTVVCTTAVEDEIREYQEFIARAEPSEVVEVRARVSGYLESVEFTDGAIVAEGDVLARVERDQYEAIHNQAQAQVELWNSKLVLAQNTLKRSEDLLKSQAISDAEYDEAVAAVKEAEAQIRAATADVERAALDLKYCDIVAPIAGRIDRALVTRGNLVSGGLIGGTLLTNIVNNQPMYVYMDATEASLLRFLRSSSQRRQESDRDPEPIHELKTPCWIQLADESDFIREGVIDFASNQVDAETGSIRVRAVFENSDRLLTGGMFVRARVPQGEPYEAVNIPESAIGTDLSFKFAYVVGDDSTAERRTLELGPVQDGQQVVRKGIQPGERVISQGIQKVRPGMKVKVQEQTATQADDTANEEETHTEEEAQQ